MLRDSYRLAHLLLIALTVSSCTCGTEAPPPPAPAVATRPPGFQLNTAAPKATETQVPTATVAAPASPTPAQLALPDDFPSDIKVMDGLTLAGVQKLGGGAQNVLFTTDVDPAKTFDYYKDDLKQKGHDVTQQYQTADQSFLSFKKGNLVTNVVIAKDPRDPKKRVVGIMYYEEQPAEDF